MNATDVETRLVRRPSPELPGIPRFAIELPTTWTIGQAPGFNLVAMAPELPDQPFRANLTITAERVPAGVTPLALADRAIEDIKASHPGFVLEQRQQSDPANSQLTTVTQIVDFELPEAGLTLLQLHSLLALPPERPGSLRPLYTVTGTCAVEQRYTFGHQVLNLLGTFIIESPAASVTQAGPP